MSETREMIEQLQAALRPFAEIGCDVLKEHPGWANHVFSSEWAGYRITFVQFEAAAAAYIAAELDHSRSGESPPSKLGY